MCINVTSSKDTETNLHSMNTPSQNTWISFRVPLSILVPEENEPEREIDFYFLSFLWLSLSHPGRAIVGANAWGPMIAGGIRRAVKLGLELLRWAGSRLELEGRGIGTLFYCLGITDVLSEHRASWAMCLFLWCNKWPSNWSAWHNCFLNDHTLPWEHKRGSFFPPPLCADL